MLYYIYISCKLSCPSGGANEPHPRGLRVLPLVLRKHNGMRKREYARIMRAECPKYGFIFWGGDSIMREYRRSRVPLLNPRYTESAECFGPGLEEHIM